MWRTVVPFVLIALLAGCSYPPITHSRVTLYDQQTGKQTQKIDIAPTQEWDAATQKVGTDTKLVKAGERVINRTADKMPEYLADFANRIQKQGVRQ